MTIGEILDTGFQLLRSDFVALFVISLVLSIPSALANFLAQGFSQNPSAAGIATAIVAVLATLLISPIVTAAITHGLAEAYLGRAIIPAEALRVGVRLYLPLVGTGLLAAIVIVIGFFLLVIPGLYAALAFALVYQIVVLESTAGVSALKRSHLLAKGNLLRIFAVYFVAFLLYAVASFGLSLATAGVPAIGIPCSAILVAIYQVYVSAAMVVLYFDLRCRKEAFDLEYLATLVDQEAGAPAPVV